MEIIVNKEDFANSIKIVEKVTAQKAIQPILSNILISNFVYVFRISLEGKCFAKPTIKILY